MKPKSPSKTGASVKRLKLQVGNTPSKPGSRLKPTKGGKS